MEVCGTHTHEIFRLGIRKILLAQIQVVYTPLDAVVIGEIITEHEGRVVVTTEIGAETLLPQPSGELLPRIC